MLQRTRGLETGSKGQDSWWLICYQTLQCYQVSLNHLSQVFSINSFKLA